ncbi:hypothetical protein B566_EDAN001547 [Ephemera danica]|nr:hypothetical protein B566_EDAN001547 [Ephemera danica]
MRPHIRRVKYILRFFVLTAAALVFLSVIVLKNTSVAELTELEKCPACFGVTFCPLINSGRIQLHAFSTWFNVKNVYFAESPLGTIVLKKLGHDWELKALDEYICQLIGNHHDPESCVPSDIIWKLQDVKAAIFTVIKSNNTRTRSSFTFCPAVDFAQMDDIIDRVSVRAKGVGYKTLLVNILTMLIINPEPIILEAFPALDGWPFPRHLGSCGRLTAEESAGSRLSWHLHSSWYSRASIALQLLQAARQLTFQDPRYALYLTDLSVDNVVLDSAGKVTIVDLGNIILVDKYPPLAGRVGDWSEMHTSERLTEDCDTCFAYSVQDICSHKISDHNYYTVCQFLALHAVLQDPPANVLRVYPQLESLLHECLNPEMDNGRYVAVRHLIPILANLTLSQ